MVSHWKAMLYERTNFSGKTMNVLLTNDDGIHAPGLWALIEAFSVHHRVTVVAPNRERSAVGHGITLHQPLRYEKIQGKKGGEVNAFSVNGTPADCVKLAVAEVLDIMPDIVVSGINPGANVGININYSGTVAAAKEATLAGIPAMAVSIQAPGTGQLKPVAGFAESLSIQMLEKKLPVGTFLNVNFPDLPMEEIRGVRWCKQGNRVSVQHFEKRRDPMNRSYFWQGVDEQGAYHQPNVDGRALYNRYVSITPVKCDMTDYDTLRDLAQWEISLKKGESHD